MTATWELWGCLVSCLESGCLFFGKLFWKFNPKIIWDEIAGPKRREMNVVVAGVDRCDLLLSRQNKSVIDLRIRLWRLWLVGHMEHTSRHVVLVGEVGKPMTSYDVISVVLLSSYRSSTTLWRVLEVLIHVGMPTCRQKLHAHLPSTVPPGRSLAPRSVVKVSWLRMTAPLQLRVWKRHPIKLRNLVRVTHSSMKINK